MGPGKFLGKPNSEFVRQEIANAGQVAFVVLSVLIPGVKHVHQ
jgi:hypothetical protein